MLQVEVSKEKFESLRNMKNDQFNSYLYMKLRMLLNHLEVYDEGIPERKLKEGHRA